MADTLKICVELRPNAKWGYYGYPLATYGSKFIKRSFHTLLNKSMLTTLTLFSILFSIISGCILLII